MEPRPDQNMPTPANGNGPPSPRPFTRDRMNVLDASRGIDATVAQNASHLPSCRRYCSTFDR